jgi:glutamate synthase domain-containing protein 2
MVDKYFTGTSTQVEGIGVFEVMEEAIRLHRQAFGDDAVLATMLDAGGEYAYRVRGEEHMWTPDVIAKLQHSTRTGKYETYKEYAALINDQTQRHMTCAACSRSRRQDLPCRSTRSSRRKRSSSVSPPAPCRWGRFRPKRTAPWRSP